MGHIRLTGKEKLHHLIWWIAITIFLSIVDPGEGKILFQVIATLLIMFSYALVYYLEFLWIFPKYYTTHKLKMLLSIVLAFLLYMTVKYFNFYVIMSIYGTLNDFYSKPWYNFETTNIFIFLTLTIVAFGSYQNRMSIAKIRSKNEMEKALLIKELGFFKNQFNSHITFNFLNYCYHYVHEASKEAGEAIELFSGMLRYTIDSKPDEKVSLAKEMDYIDKFIQLKKQLSKGICVEIHSLGNLDGKSILPRMLITFVENAFKHGKTHEGSTPILITLHSTSEQLTFEVKNAKNKSKIPLSTGIGQNNLKQQLELFYKGKYDLQIAEDEDTYACKLILNT